MNVGSTSESLLEGLRLHDEESWTDLCAIYGPEVFLLARRQNVPADEAGDIVQEAFRRVFVSLPKFRREKPGDSFRGWLYRIAMNLIRDHFRRQSHEPRGVGGLSHDRQLQEQPTPAERHSDASEVGDDMDSEFAELARIQQRAFELLHTRLNPSHAEITRQFVAGRSPADIAKDLNLKLNTVHQIISRVRRRIRKYLEELD